MEQSILESSFCINSSDTLDAILKKTCSTHKNASIVTICFDPECIKNLTCFLCSLCHKKHHHKEECLPYFNLFSNNLVNEINKLIKDSNEVVNEFNKQHIALVGQINNFYDEIEQIVINQIKESRKSILKSFMHIAYPNLVGIETFQDLLDKFQKNRSIFMDEVPENISEKGWKEFLKSFHSLYNMQVAALEMQENITTIPGPQIILDAQGDEMKEWTSDFQHRFKAIIKSMESYWFPQKNIAQKYENSLDMFSQSQTDSPCKMNTTQSPYLTKQPSKFKFEAMQIKKINENEDLWEILGVSKELSEFLRKKQIKCPNESQSTSLKMLKSKTKCVGVIQVFSGFEKILSYLVPILNLIDPQIPHLPMIENRGKKQVFILSPQALVIAYNKESVNFISQMIKDFVVDEMYTFKNIKVCAVKSENLELLKYGGDILVLTAHMLKTLIENKKPFMIKGIESEEIWITMNCKQTKLVIMDDGDELAAMEEKTMKPFLGDILRILNIEIPILCVSTCISERLICYLREVFPERDVIRRKMKKYKPHIHGIKQAFLETNPNDKMDPMVCILHKVDNYPQTIIYIDSDSAAEEMKTKFNEKKISCSLILSIFETEQIEKNLNEFCESKSKVLITTNLLPKSFEWYGPVLIVNMNIKITRSDKGKEIADYNIYLQRIIRIAKHELSGLCLNLVAGEKERKYLEELEKYFNIEMTKIQSYHEIKEIFQELIIENKENSICLLSRSNSIVKK